MTKIEAKFFPSKTRTSTPHIILDLGLLSPFNFYLSIPEAKLLAKKLEKALGRAGK